MEEHRRKSRPKEKENPLLSALKTKCLKVERRGGERVLKSHTAKELTWNWWRCGKLHSTMLVFQTLIGDVV